MLRTLLFTGTLLVSLSSFSQERFLVPSDQDYFVQDDGAYQYIYTAEQRALIPELVKYNRLFKQIYETEFNWMFDEQATLILASTQNQIANGFATTLPSLHTAYYGGGAEIIDEFSVQSWLYTLLSHETSHLYQLNIKRGYGQTMKSIFGNSTLAGTAFLPPFTYTATSNAFLPTFLLEGNSTFNESRFGNGGRLYSGAARALMLQMARTGEINMGRLMNDHSEFPYGREKYIIGGFFFLDLARNHGVETANRFFYTHADYKFNPFNVGDPFIQNFGISYYSALNRFVESWLPLAVTQKSAPEAVLFTSASHAGISQDKTEIRTLTTNGKALPAARVYNISTKTWEAKTVNMPMGKLFRDNKNKLVATSSETVNNHQVRAGLFGEGYNFNTKDLDKYFYDIQGPRKLWASAKSSYEAPNLFMNTKENNKLGSSASSAIIGTDGAAYFFKQSGKTRTLMRNQTPVFSYKGYYGFPVGANDGKIYFIGPSLRGSSLYFWKNAEFFRASESDTIIDARLVDENSAFVAEVTAKSYEYKITKLTPQAEAPAEYNYFMEKEKHAQLLSQVVSEQNETPPDFKINDKAYSSFRNWQFDGIDPLIFFGIDTFATIDAQIRFSDPLQNHELSLLLSSGSFGEYGAGFQYRNSKYVVNWDIVNLYRRQAYVVEDTTQETGYEVLDLYDNWLASLGFNYTFFKRPQWAAELRSHFVYENEDPALPLSDIDKKYTVLSELQVSHEINTPLSYSTYKLLNLDLANEYIRTAPDWEDQRNIYGGEATASYDIFRETYLSASYQASYTDSPFAIIDFDDGPDDFPYPSPTQVRRNTEYINQNYFEVRKTSAELRQALNWSLYFARFPLSLRRLAIFGQYNEYYGSVNKRENVDTLFHEYGGGIEMELLLLNKFPFRATWSNFVSSYAKDASTIIVLGAQQRF